jgi:hypothetical protein
MNTTDIIERLQQLQIEQNELFAQLTTPEAKSKGVVKNNSEEGNELKIGDHITLLSSGVRSKKGDTARVTATKGKTVKFVVVRNGHSTHRKRNNVRKVE